MASELLILQISKGLRVNIGPDEKNMIDNV